jgi:hypothetical protein
LPEKSYGIIREHYDENQIDLDSKKACRVEFMIDPSLSKVKDENIALVRYLKERNLSIDLFDSNSKFHFGTVKLPLTTLLRQGKEVQSSGQEVDICEPKYSNVIGKLQIIMTNQVVSPTDPTYLKGLSRHTQPNQKKHRYKHVKSKPLSLAQIGEGSFQQHLTTYIAEKDTQNSEQARQQLRIEKMKKKKMHKTAMEHMDDGAETWQKKTALTHISFIRDQQKGEVIDNLLKHHKSMEKDLEVRPGEPTFLSILVGNSAKKSDIYSVKFEDPDQHILNTPELSLVHNYNDKNEWKYWHENGKCTDPPTWDMVDDNGNIYLDPNQQCPILFKFFSYRETIVSRRKADLNDPRTLTPRTITVKIFQQSDESLVKSININILPRPNPIDHTFRFYSPENSYLTLTLPSFTSIPLSSHPDLFIQ